MTLEEDHVKALREGSQTCSGVCRKQGSQSVLLKRARPHLPWGFERRILVVVSEPRRVAVGTPSFKPFAAPFRAPNLRRGVAVANDTMTTSPITTRNRARPREDAKRVGGHGSADPILGVSGNLLAVPWQGISPSCS